MMRKCANYEAAENKDEEKEVSARRKEENK